MEIKLTSVKSVVVLYIGMILLLLLMPILLGIISKGEFHLGKVLGPFFYLLLFCFLIYQFVYLCQVKLINNTLVIKKLFRPERTYTFDKIGDISSFQLKRTVFVTFKMRNEDNTMEKYLTASTSSLLASDKIDVKETLLNLRNTEL